MPMLKATQRLLALRDEPHAPWGLTHGLRRVIIERGSAEDVPPLLEWFLESPDRDGPLWPIMAHGGPEDAARLFAACASGGELRPGVDPTVLHALGYLGHEPARPLMLRYLQGSHSEYQAAVMGLLHLPLGEASAHVREQILACRGRGLFSEFLPALAASTGDPELLPVLFEMGKTASTDCNGGLVLGIALYGEAGRPFFQRLIDDPWWEAAGHGTGTDRYAWYGMRVLGMTCAGLVTSLFARGRDESGGRPEPKVLAHQADFALTMMAKRVRAERAFLKFVDERPLEPIEALFRTAFTWSTPHHNDSLTGAVSDWFGHQHRLNGVAHAVETSLREALARELLEAEGPATR
jgi:hypothetical protein